LYIDLKNEKLVAHYTNKTVLLELLENSKFRLNNIDYSNDPNEGKTLLRYLFKKKYPARRVLNNGDGAFIGSFTFNYDSLNQFRLYGKEDEREGTGVSFVFDSTFFSKEAKMAIEQLSSDKYALFRCIYIDPIRQKVETIGHKESYLFYREKNNEESNEDIDKKIKDYKEEIDKTSENIEDDMIYIRKLAQNLESTIVGQLLINLRYLTKHVAFKEEQECRIVKIHRLKPEETKPEKLNHKKVMVDKSRRIYIEYEPKFFDHVKKIYFGPKAADEEFFQDILINKGISVIIEKSESSLT
jgi:hypothetical protein